MKLVYKSPLVRTLITTYDWVGTRFRPRKQPPHPTVPKHICCIMLHQIGDVIMTFPTLKAIHTLYPQAKLTLIAGPGPAKLLEHNPWGADVIPFEALWQPVVRQFSNKPITRDRLREAKQSFLQHLQKDHPDVAVIFHPDLQVNQLVRQTDIPTTIGFANAGGGFHLTHPLDMLETGHQVERNYQLVEAIAELWHRPLPELTPAHFAPTKEENDAVAQKLKTKEINAKRLVVLHPFASAATKNWSVAFWAQVITWLNKNNFTPVVIGGAKDTWPKTDSEIKKELDQAVSVCGLFNLRETAALIEKAVLFIGIDSGPGHIASAVGCPLISIFSSVHDPERWAPYGQPNKTIILHQPVTDRRQFPYEMRDLPVGVIGNPYSDQITPQDVIAAAEALLVTIE